MRVKAHILHFICKIRKCYLTITVIEAIIILLFGSIIISYRGNIVQINSKAISIDSNDKTDKLYHEKCIELYERNKEVLILVNYDNAIPNDYKLDLRYTESKKKQVANVLYDDLVLMLKDAKNAGYTYWIASGYRSMEMQQDLIDEHIDTCINEGMSMEEAQNNTYKILEKPGRSEHHTGLAIDLLSSDNLNMDESQESSQGNKWLRDNSYKYGFILRYPRGKESITHINYEPWHFRYVGRETADFIYDNNLTLEEFYEHL